MISQIQAVDILKATFGKCNAIQVHTLHKSSIEGYLVAGVAFIVSTFYVFFHTELLGA